MKVLIQSVKEILKYGIAFSGKAVCIKAELEKIMLRHMECNGFICLLKYNLISISLHKK